MTPSTGLHLAINEDDNSLDYELATEVIDFFQLDRGQAVKIMDEVLASVARWREVAGNIGISREEQELMKPACNL